jgi:hypothetical protein
MAISQPVAEPIVVIARSPPHGDKALLQYLLRVLSLTRDAERDAEQLRRGLRIQCPEGTLVAARVLRISS